MNICVFTAASDVDEKYREMMYQLGRKLGEGGHTLVFGGYDSGLMGKVADGFADAGADIIGIVPDSLEAAERHHHHGLTSIIHTKDLTERKEAMVNLSDIIVAAPGGTGTLDELFSVMASKYTGEIDKKIVLYNAFGYYDSLIKTLEEMEAEGFVHDLNRIVKIADSPDDILY